MWLTVHGDRETGHPHPRRRLVDGPQPVIMINRQSFSPVSYLGFPTFIYQMRYAFTPKLR